MTTQEYATLDIDASQRDALANAVSALENPNLAARIADYAGAPVNRVLRLLPRSADAGISKAAEAAMLRCLKTAIRTLDDKTERAPKPWMSSMAAGVTGGVGGFMGIAGLPFELPVTTTLMLRAIAGIARHNGEDLSQLEARMACLQVFALGARPGGARGDVGYFAARTLLTRMSGNAVAHLVERGALELSGPMMNSFISELVSRFAIVVSDRIAASALPVVGAIGGATINVVFMNHFQRIAQGHFTVRRLERRYGSDLIRRHYGVLAAHARPGNV